MGGNLRFWLAASILALLGLLYLARPGTLTLLEAQSPTQVGDMQAELISALEARLEEIASKRGPRSGKEGGEDPEGSSREESLLAGIGGRPLTTHIGLALDGSLPEGLPEKWRDVLSSGVKDSPYLTPTEKGGTGKLSFVLFWREREPGSQELRIFTAVLPGGGPPFEKRTSRSPSEFLGLIPPFFVILMALLTGRIIPSLFAGVLLGAIFAAGPLGGLVLFAWDWICLRVFSEEFKILVLGFVLMLSAAVGIMTRSGGIEGMVDLVKKVARTARSSQLATWLMGLMIFFDDYANSIVVGSTMRPLTDRLRVSREKLSYIVDSTAAPIAGLVFLSTWVVTEISYFEPQLDLVEAPGGGSLAGKGFEVFQKTIPFRFYCILTIFMVLATILTKREFGPMLRAEERARREGKPIADGATPMVHACMDRNQPEPGTPRRWQNGVFPILSLILVTLFVIWWTGKEAAEGKGLSPGDYLFQVFGNADSTLAIFIGATSAALLAGLLGVFQGIMKPLETLLTGLQSMRALFFAFLILVLAWCIGFVCDELGSRYYLSAMAQSSKENYWLLPTILFLVSCLVSFATGSSWSTMAILLPNVVIMANELGRGTEMGSYGLVVLSIGAVLEGSIFGDHCSPISDTTVLSSTASASDHLDHVKTQAPYALLVMLVSIFCGYLPVAGLGLPWELSMLLGAGVILIALHLLGRDPGAACPPGEGRLRGDARPT